MNKQINILILQTVAHSAQRAPEQPAASNRRRSSADLEFNYPGDILSQVRRKKAAAPLLKRNTIADFANTKAYQESTASLISASDQGIRLYVTRYKYKHNCDSGSLDFHAYTSYIRHALYNMGAAMFKEIWCPWPCC